MLSIVLLAAAATATPTPLTPVGPWFVRAEDNLCLLQRDYVDGTQKTSLIFEPLLDTSDMEVFVITPDHSVQQTTGKASASITRYAQSWAGDYFSLYSTGMKARVTRLTIKHTLLEQVQDGDAMRVIAKPIDRTFTIVHPGPARYALSNCLDDLKRSWGIDPKITQRPEVLGSPIEYFNSYMYPYEALRAGIAGRVVALLNVGQELPHRSIGRHCVERGDLPSRDADAVQAAQCAGRQPDRLYISVAGEVGVAGPLKGKARAMALR